mgnify:CR=1 FL=1
MIFLQAISQTLPTSAPDSSFSFWMISQVIVTGIIFAGVYFILKPVFSKKEDDIKKDQEK